MLSISVLSLFSCTNENQEQGLENNQTEFLRLCSSNLEDAKKLYEEMIKSEDYESYKAARTDFILKMKGNIVFLKTKAEYMDWIHDNINSTDFESVSAFEDSLDDMVNKQSVLREKNNLLYTYLDDADSDQYLVIIGSNLGQAPILYVTNSCSSGCMDKCERTLTNIEQGTAFNQAMYGGNPFTDAIIDAMYWSMFQDAVGDFNSCMSSC